MYIGISGKIGVGKTTVAKMLLKKFPSYKKIAFGDFLKQEVSQKFNSLCLTAIMQKTP